MANNAKRIGIAAGILTAASAIAMPFIGSHEGVRLHAYRDVGGVETICDGETQGVHAGEHLTKAQCDAMTQRRVTEFQGQVLALLTRAPSPDELAAFTSFAYNLGIHAFAKSSTLREFNAGHDVLACEAMKNYYMAGGKDCRIRANDCYGVYKRRLDEVKLCNGGSDAK